MFGIGVDSDDRAPVGAKEAYFAAFATRARAAAPDVPIMLTGGIRTRAAMESLLGCGAVDVIGLGRPLALDPELPAAARRRGRRPAATYRLPTVPGSPGSRSGTRPSSAGSATAARCTAGSHPARAVGSLPGR